MAWPTVPAVTVSRLSWNVPKSGGSIEKLVLLVTSLSAPPPGGV